MQENLINGMKGQEKRSKRKRISALAVAIGLVASLAPMILRLQVGASGESGSLARPAPLTRARSISSPTPARTAVETGDDLQVKLVTVTARGFEPDEMLVSQKRFVLAIDNRSQLDELSIQFSQLTGNPAAPLNQLQQLRMPRAKVNANTAFELPPGDYVLTEANHPGWVCKFIVTAK